MTMESRAESSDEQHQNFSKPLDETVKNRKGPCLLVIYVCDVFMAETTCPRRVGNY